MDAPYRWVGREYDPETGFYFMRARYYDPAVGRFTQEDPLGTAGGTNLYAYVDGQPLEARDPSGLLRDHALDDPCPCFAASAGWDGWWGVFGTGWLFRDTNRDYYTDVYKDGQFVRRVKGWIVDGTTNITVHSATGTVSDAFFKLLGSNFFLEGVAEFANSSATLDIFETTASFNAQTGGNRPGAGTDLWDVNNHPIENPSGERMTFDAAQLAKVYIFISLTDFRDPALFSQLSRSGSTPSILNAVAHEFGHALDGIHGVYGDEWSAYLFECQSVYQVGGRC